MKTSKTTRIRLLLFLGALLLLVSSCQFLSPAKECACQYFHDGILYQETREKLNWKSCQELSSSEILEVDGQRVRFNRKCEDAF